MRIKPHVLWLKMKYWQWQNNGPAPDEKVDMMLLRYGTEYKRMHATEEKIERDNFENEEDLIKALVRRRLAQEKHFDQFIEGLKRTATTPESKALYAEVRWILETQTGRWGHTLEDVRESRIWYHTTGPEIRRLGLEDRVRFGFAPWYEHITYWYKRLTGKLH